MCVNFDLLNNQSFAGGRKQYLTRRRKKLNQARMEESCSEPTPKKKPARIIVLSDSSGEETSVSQGKATKTGCLGAERESAAVPRSLPPVSAVQRNKTAGEISVRQPGERKSEKLLSLKASVSEMLDFQPQRPALSTHVPPAVPGSGKERLQAPHQVGVDSQQGAASPLAPRAGALWQGCLRGCEQDGSRERRCAGNGAALLGSACLSRLPCRCFRKLLYSQVSRSVR